MGQIHDEDLQIRKLEEHRDLKKLFLEIGELNGIDVRPTINNSREGDFVYPAAQHDKFVEGINVFLGNKKA